jgi:hypothetical protein
MFRVLGPATISARYLKSRPRVQSIVFVAGIKNVLGKQALWTVQNPFLLSEKKA